MRDRIRKTPALPIVLVAIAMFWTPANAQCEISMGSTAQSTSSSSPFADHSAWVGVFSNGVVFWIFDANEGTVATFGRSAEDWKTHCASETPQPVAFADWQVVFLPYQVESVMVLINGDDIPTAAWPFQAGDGQDICDIILSRDPLATGTSDMMVTDNDFYAPYSDHHRRHAFGVLAHGFLRDATGDRVVMNANYRCSWDYYPPPPCGQCTPHVELN